MGWVLVHSLAASKTARVITGITKWSKRADFELSSEGGQKRISEVVTTPSTDKTCRKQLGATLVAFRQILYLYDIEVHDNMITHNKTIASQADNTLILISRASHAKREVGPGSDPGSDPGLSGQNRLNFSTHHLSKMRW